MSIRKRKRKITFFQKRLDFTTEKLYNIVYDFGHIA